MVHSQKTPWTLITGPIMVAYARAVQSGVMARLIKYLGTARHAGEMQILAYAYAASPSQSGCGNSSPRPQNAASSVLMNLNNGSCTRFDDSSWRVRVIF